MVIKLSGTSQDKKFFSKSVIGQDSRRQVRSAQLNRRRQFQFVISNLAHCCFILLKGCCTSLPLYLRDGGQFRSILWIPICSLSHLLPFPTFLLLKGNTLGSISAIDPASCVLLAMPSLIKTIQHMNHLKTLAPSLSLTNLSICSSLPKPAPHLRLYDAAKTCTPAFTSESC